MKKLTEAVANGENLLGRYVELFDVDFNILHTGTIVNVKASKVYVKWEDDLIMPIMKNDGRVGIK